VVHHARGHHGGGDADETGSEEERPLKSGTAGERHLRFPARQLDVAQPGRDLPIDSRRVAYKGGPKNEDATALRQLPFHSASCHSASLAAIIIIMITTITTALIAVVIAAAFLPSCPIECPCGG